MGLGARGGTSNWGVPGAVGAPEGTLGVPEGTPGTSGAAEATGPPGAVGTALRGISANAAPHWATPLRDQHGGHRGTPNILLQQLWGAPSEGSPIGLGCLQCPPFTLSLPVPSDPRAGSVCPPHPLSVCQAPQICTPPQSSAPSLPASPCQGLAGANRDGGTLHALHVQTHPGVHPGGSGGAPPPLGAPGLGCQPSARSWAGAALPGAPQLGAGGRVGGVRRSRGAEAGASSALSSSSSPQDAVLNACYRGCRLFSICHFVDASAELNTTRAECEAGERSRWPSGPRAPNAVPGGIPASIPPGVARHPTPSGASRPAQPGSGRGQIDTARVSVGRGTGVPGAEHPQTLSPPLSQPVLKPTATQRSSLGA